ncbi:MAG TPA: YbaK/EbsC family protein [Dehalococcoidia bacterium]|nr:YbaK/EbsC family protein [Dehalococcoidia bacterium]
MADPAQPGSQPDTMQAPALAGLYGRAVPFRLAPRVDGAQTLAEFAAKSGLRPRQVVKSLLLELNGGGYALLVAAGDRTADFAALRRHFGVRSVRMADPEAVQRVTGYRIGRVTPLALATPDLPVLVDAALVAEDEVSLGIGMPGQHVRLRGADLPAAVGGEPGEWTRAARNGESG